MPFSEANNDFDPYAELQLSSDAEPELVKAAFKALAKKYHPDRFHDPAKKAEAERRMARINEAQRLLQEGNYRPPAAKKEPSKGSSAHTPAPPPAKVTPPQPRPPRSKAKTDLGLTPFIAAGLIFLSLLVLPQVFSTDHLQKALELESQGQLQESLEHLNQAVAASPQNRELYEHRARLWEKLDQPARAAVDRDNAREPVLNLRSTPTPEL